SSHKLCVFGVAALQNKCWKGAHRVVKLYPDVALQHPFRNNLPSVSIGAALPPPRCTGRAVSLSLSDMKPPYFKLPGPGGPEFFLAKWFVSLVGSFVELRSSCNAQKS